MDIDIDIDRDRNRDRDRDKDRDRDRDKDRYMRFFIGIGLHGYRSQEVPRSAVFKLENQENQ